VPLNTTVRADCRPEADFMLSASVIPVMVFQLWLELQLLIL